MTNEEKARILSSKDAEALNPTEEDKKRLSIYGACLEAMQWKDEQHAQEKQQLIDKVIEQLTAFAQHLNKRGAFRDDLCMDFEHEAQSFIEMQNNKEI